MNGVEGHYLCIVAFLLLYKKEKKMEIRLLKANEIECRVATINEKGLSLLLYKDARADQKLLDEAFGIFGWQREHSSIDGNLYCTVKVFDKESQSWISKQDVGTTGFTEKEKSQASDSFKRACFNWGIGRELYTAPFIWVPSDKCDIKSRADRYYTYDRFSVSDISYNEEREIIGLTIVNDKGMEVFKHYDKKRAGNTDEYKITDQQVEDLDAELSRTGVTMEDVQKRYKIGKTKKDISPETYKRIMSALKKTKSAA